MGSAVAGILDAGGGLRVVVTQRWRMRNHVKKGEQLFVLPDLTVQEPVPWNDIPRVVYQVEKHVLSKLAPTNSCGDCRACCIIPYIDFENGLKKPSYQVCTNCSEELGCKIHWTRPKPCRSFECLWLKSQSRNDVMPLELRPDKCGVIFSEDTDAEPDVFECHVLEMTKTAKAFIDAEQAIGRKAKLVTSYHGEEKP